MSAVRVITLPNSHQVTLGQYVAAWRDLLAAQPEVPVGGFFHFAEPVGRVLECISYGVHDRINQHLPWYDRGRKWNPDWQRSTGHFARAVNSRQVLMNYQCPHDFQGRIRASRFHTKDDL